MAKSHCRILRVPKKFQKHNSMIFHDQQCNFHDNLMHGLQPPVARKLAVTDSYISGYWWFRKIISQNSMIFP